MGVVLAYVRYSVRCASPHRPCHSIRNHVARKPFVDDRQRGQDAKQRQNADDVEHTSPPIFIITYHVKLQPGAPTPPPPGRTFVPPVYCACTALVPGLYCASPPPRATPLDINTGHGQRQRPGQAFMAHPASASRAGESSSAHARLVQHVQQVQMSTRAGTV